MADLHSLCRDRVRELLHAAIRADEYTTAEEWVYVAGAAEDLAREFMLAFKPPLLVSVCEGWLATLDRHPVNLGGGCRRCRNGNEPCSTVRRIASQLQIAEENR